MINIEDKLDDLKKYFKDNMNILAVWIVGSYGTEYQRDESDIDFALLFNNYTDLFDEMKIASDISSLIKYEDVDIINLQKSPVTLQFKAISQGRQVYEKDFIGVGDYIENVLNNYRNSKYYIDLFNREFLNGFQKEGI